MKKILLMALVMVTLIAVGCGSGKNEQATKLVSGIAWLDENTNGQKDSGEKLLSGIKVSLLNVNTNKILTNGVM